MIVSAQEMSQQNLVSMMQAIADENLDKIELLCQKDCNIIYAEDANGYSPLLYAAELGAKNVVRVLLKQKDIQVDFYSKNKKGIRHTALMAASIKGHIGIVKQLLDAGADVNLYPSGENSPVVLAAQNYQFSTVLLLVCHGANPDNINKNSDGSGKAPLHYACEKGDLVTVQMLIAKGATIDLQDTDGLTPLMVADAYDQEKIITYLLTEDANPIFVDNDKKTVIDYAIENKKISRVQQYQYYLNQRDYVGNTWLHRIVLSPEQTLTQLYYDEHDKTSIDDIYEKRAESVRLLLKHGADPNAINNQKQIALHIATDDESNTTSEVIFDLLFRPEDVEDLGLEVDKFENLENVHMTDFFNVRQRFRNRKFTTVSDCKLLDKKNNTPWQNAIISGNVAYVTMFLTAGANIDPRDHKLAEGTPYTKALLRLYSIIDEYLSLEKALPQFLNQFRNALFDNSTDLTDENDDNYVFIVYCIEAKLFTPAGFAETIRNDKNDRNKFDFLLKKTDEGKIFEFFEEVSLVLKPSLTGKISLDEINKKIEFSDNLNIGYINGSKMEITDNKNINSDQIKSHKKEMLPSYEQFSKGSLGKQEIVDGKDSSSEEINDKDMEGAIKNSFDTY